MRARARHAKPSRLRQVTLTTGLATAVAVPLFASPASAHTATAIWRPGRGIRCYAAGPLEVAVVQRK